MLRKDMFMFPAAEYARDVLCAPSLLVITQRGAHKSAATSRRMLAMFSSIQHLLAEAHASPSPMSRGAQDVGRGMRLRARGSPTAAPA